MHLSLRTKFILALLLSSLMVVGVFGFVAHWLLLRDFSRMALEDSFEHFRVDVAAYVNTYGSMEAAREAEPFHEFQHRYRGALDSRAARGGRPGEMDRPGNGGPPMGREGGPPDFHGGPNDFGASPPPPGSVSLRPMSFSGAAGAPPFRFLLVDLNNRVLFGDKEYAEGVAPPPSVLKERFPIVSQGKTVAWALPLSTPNLGTLDDSYLKSIQQSLVYAVVAATLLALTLGVAVGNRLSSRLRQLTTALQAVGAGELMQQVHEKEHDEIGILAQAFNRASCDLAKAHEELRQSNAKIAEQARLLREQSIRDELTELFNRRFFDEQVLRMYAEAVRYGQPLTLLIGDLDRFKEINDRYSHATGDQVLRTVARILQSNIRDSDLVARYGGEEFVIAFCHASTPQAIPLADRLRRLIEEHPWHEIHPDLKVTISMGLCSELTLGSFERMLAVADANLYHAKATGRNRLCAEHEPSPT